MAIFLVVEILDTHVPDPLASQRGGPNSPITDVYQPTDASVVQADFGDGAGLVPVGKTSTPGAFERLIPDPASRIHVHVEKQGLFNVDQNLTLNRGATPTLAFDGPQAINVRNVSNNTRGSDFTVTVHVVLGQLQDAQAKVTNVVALPPPIFLSLRNLTIIKPVTPILSPRGSPGRIQHTSPSLTPSGKLLFAERTEVPRLVAIYVPDTLVQTFQTTGPQIPTSIPCHLFFHPAIPANFTPDYPFSFSYVDLIARYLLYDQISNVGKAMTNQHDASGKNYVFIFPVGRKGNNTMGTLNSQTKALQLLQEVVYWIQRMLGMSFPIHKVGHVALSGFSAGIRFVNSVLTNGKTPVFNDDILREVYSFDGKFVIRVIDENGRPKDIISVPETTSFCTVLRSWLRRGRDSRSIRVYTQDSIWLEQLKDAITSTSITTGPDNSREAESPGSTILLAPTGFWASVDADIATRIVRVPPGGLFQPVHQFIPAMFMGHALSLSAL